MSLLSNNSSEFKLFVGNMPGDVTSDEIESVFRKFGTIVEVHIMCGNRSKSGQSSAFVKFISHESCEAAISEMHLKGTIRIGDPIMLVVKYAKPPSHTPHQSPHGFESISSTTANSSPSTTPLSSPRWSKVFVGGMPSYVDRDDLIALFSPFGRVESVHLMNKNKSKSGQSCAFVNYFVRESSIAAIEALNAKYVIQEDLPPITVRFSDPVEQQPKRLKTMSLMSVEKMAHQAAISILEQCHVAT